MNIKVSTNEHNLMSIPAHTDPQETQPAGAFSLYWPMTPGCPGYAGELAAGILSK